MSLRVAKKQLRELAADPGPVKSEGKEQGKESLSKRAAKRRRVKAFPQEFAPKPKADAKQRRLDDTVKKMLRVDKSYGKKSGSAAAVLAMRSGKELPKKEIDGDDMDDEFLDGFL
mmetsp:Transcript_54032/g.126271  ORF Transcript_54032/g.126271 Transcript_54032/m.126271 type:complete len:115 (-) Transcript_54032:28-372(-)